MTNPILHMEHLGAPPWKTLDPFLFCVHHDDAYPAGNPAMGPAASLAGRNIGSDFAGRDGWRMYHGDTVPGFPRHPHRGFETITLARRGYIDHSDSLGATARFGHGDVQWMTAGKGVVHSEMFPLVHQDRPNPTELFQIWLNLPAKRKMVPPHFTMLWSPDIPRVVQQDEAGRKTEVVVMAGALGADRAPSPPPDSWASDPRSDLAIWTIEVDAEGEWILPAAPAGVNRMLYFFAGDALTLDGHPARCGVGIQVRPEQPIAVKNGPIRSELLMLQGRPIGEPVAQYGPFVMNTRNEIRQAFADYQRTGFGGWPWASDGPVHAREAQRFAVHATGKKERPA
ncbi:MAG: pirin family protein [Myxococcota bacterium]